MIDGMWNGRGRPVGRAVTPVAALGLGLAGLTACGDSAGPGAGAVTTEDLQGVQDQLAGLEDRVGVLEESAGAAEGGAGTADDTEAFFADTASSVGEEVTVSAEVSELVTTTDVGSAFRIAPESGDPIAIVSATPSPQLDQDDVVRVTGTVMEVAEESFEQDFGLAADELFEDSTGWFEAEEGEIAVSATEIEVLQEQAAG